MCGIGGVVDFAGAPVASSDLRALASALQHRGPDHETFFQWEGPQACVGLVHRRLSIIDLSPAAHQPMTSVDSPLVLVANGEKFNYRELGDADLVVLPCVDDRQRGGEMGGIPVALMEAMAAGKPVISTRLSGIPELIDDGVSGVLVPPGDPAALAAAMAKLLDDRQMRLTLGTAARRVVEARFDLERNTSALLADFLTAMAVAQPHEDRDPRT